MPAPGKRWRHVIINTKGSWLHGDRRGFRSRDHRIDSSGDYRNPPRQGEHRDLNAYQQSNSAPEVKIPRELRPIIGRAILEHFRDQRQRVLTVAVTTVHAHALVELPDHMITVKTIVGHAKRKSSRAIKAHIPGSVWSAGGTYRPVDSASHQKAAYAYILYDQGRDAWTWSGADRSLEGKVGRKRPPKKK